MYLCIVIKTISCLFDTNTNPSWLRHFAAWSLDNGWYSYLSLFGICNQVLYIWCGIIWTLTSGNINQHTQRPCMTRRFCAFQRFVGAEVCWSRCKTTQTLGDNIVCVQILLIPWHICQNIAIKNLLVYLVNVIYDIPSARNCNRHTFFFVVRKTSCVDDEYVALCIQHLQLVFLFSYCKHCLIFYNHSPNNDCR